MNILVFVPGFLEDKTKLDREHNQAVQRSLRQRIETQLVELFNWRWKWDEINPNAVHEQQKTEDRERQNTPFQTTLQFSTFSESEEIASYNTILLWLLSLICRFFVGIKHTWHIPRYFLGG
jgi:hypothetical protein